jgi:hypothetical protein
MRLWLRFQSLTPAERRLVVEASVLLGLVWIGLRTCTFASLRRALAFIANRPSRKPAEPLPVIAWAVEASARRLPGHRTCLIRALAAHVMLRRRAYTSEVHLGLRRTTDSSHRLDGHAWVTCGEEVVVGGVEHLADYACLISCPPG